jgi:hypothetical protein
LIFWNQIIIRRGREVVARLHHRRERRICGEGNTVIGEEVPLGGSDTVAVAMAVVVAEATATARHSSI